MKWVVPGRAARREICQPKFAPTCRRGLRPQPHPHLICSLCGAIEDVDVDGLDDETEAVSTSTGYKIVSTRTDYYGICPTCQTAEE